MSDHQHHAIDIQGAALDGHTHSARDVGAAGEHDFEMLKRSLQVAESNIAVLERKDERQTAEVQDLKDRVRELEEYCRQHSENFNQLGQQVIRIAARLSNS